MLEGLPVDDGESTLTLQPRGREARPTYTYEVQTTLPEGGEGDIGNWSAKADRVTFTSLRDGGGTRVGTLQSGEDGAVRLALVGRSGRRFTFRLVRPNGGGVVHGAFFVAVVDATGRQLGGAQFRLRAPDGIVTRGGSTEFRAFGVDGPVGEWVVTATPPPGYAFAPGQTNPARVTMRAWPAGTIPTDTVRIGLVVERR